MYSRDLRVPIQTASVSFALLRSPMPKAALTLLVLTAVVAGCAGLSIKPQPIQPSDPVTDARAIEAEPVPPTKIVVRDFEVFPSSVRENASPLHRLISLFGKVPLRSIGPNWDIKQPRASRKKP